MNTAKIFAVICLAAATSIASFQVLMIFRGDLPFATVVPFVGINGAVIGGLFYLGIDAISAGPPEGQVKKKILLIRDSAGRVLSISRGGGGEGALTAFPSKKPIEIPKLSQASKAISLGKSMMALGFVLELFLSFMFVSNTITPLLIVQTGSMEPTIKTGEMIWIKGVSASQIQVGDIITYNIPQTLVVSGAAKEATTITHRVVDVTYGNDNKVSFRTKGDNNALEDTWVVTPEMLVGRYQTQIPYIGPIFTAVRSPIGIVTVAAIVIALIGVPELIKKGGAGDV